MDLDSRKQRILEAIVLDHVRTAEPVGSQALLARHDLGCKSATIRNEMAEMEDRGYLRQPHTSAGRIPSYRGYRFYVNRLMVLTPILRIEERTIQRQMTDVASELESVLRKTCQLLAQMTRLPAVATPPEASKQLQLTQVFVSPAAVDRVLLVLLFSSGRTEHRLVTLSGARLAATDALLFAGVLSERFCQKPLSELPKASAAPPPAELLAQRVLYERLVREIALATRAVTDDATVYVEGAQSALDQPEFRHIERLSQFFVMLQERVAMLEVLGNELSAASVTVRIGDEFGRPELSEFAVVSAPYFIGDTARGSLGVIGPMRMDYARAAASVQFMASSVSEVLTRLAVA
jgi:heat-inducible transcriptional repressor